MFDGTLGTTNLFLGILAAVSIVEAIVLTVVLISSLRLAQVTGALVRDLDHQLSALSQRLGLVMESIENSAHNVERFTSRVAVGAERAQFAFDATAGLLSLIGSAGHRPLASPASRLIRIGRGFAGAYRILNGRRRSRQVPASGDEARPV